MPVDPKRVSHTLLFVAILQFIMGPIATQLVSRHAGPGGSAVAIPPSTYVILWTGVGGLFAFAALARRKPLPAAVAALGLFISIHAVDAATGRIPLANGIIYKVFALAFLIRAVRTAKPPTP